MEERPPTIDPSLRLRYELIPAVLDTARAKRHLTVFLARTSLDESEAADLASIQLARWYCDDLLEDIELDVLLLVPENASAIRDVFERLGVGHGVVAAVDEEDADAISAAALEMDVDVLLGTNVERLRDLLIDDVMLVVESIGDVLLNVEAHLKGFDVPWSFEFPTKMQPWTNFYAMCEPNTFTPLQMEWRASAAAGPDVENKMRILVAQSLPAMCFNRDRMEFYRQQDRWTDRNNIERQDFPFEYTNALNNFYVTMYSAIDLIATICVDIFGLAIPKEQVYAISGLFRKRRGAVAGLDELFGDKVFWKMYRRPRLIRHQAAHSGPVTPEHIYTGDDTFSDEQLDAAADANGFFHDLRILEKFGPLPEAVRQDAVNLARFKAKLKLLGRPIKHALVLRDGSKLHIYNPDPRKELKRFLEFVDRALALIKP